MNPEAMSRIGRANEIYFRKHENALEDNMSRLASNNLMTLQPRQSGDLTVDDVRDVERMV